MNTFKVQLIHGISKRNDYMLSVCEGYNPRVIWIYVLGQKELNIVH